MFSTRNSQACVLPVFTSFHQIPPPNLSKWGNCSTVQRHQSAANTRPSVFLPENHKHPCQLSSTAFPVKATHSNHSSTRGLIACRLKIFCLCLLSLHCRHWSPNPPSGSKQLQQPQRSISTPTREYRVPGKALISNGGITVPCKRSQAIDRAIVTLPQS